MRNPNNGIKNWIKEIILLLLLIGEVIVTFFGYRNNWDTEVKFALIVAGVLTLFHSLYSILSKLDTDHTLLRNASKKEHDEIKGIMDLYKDIEGEEYVTYFEGSFVNEQENNAEIWVISNDVAEPDDILNEIKKNLKRGIHYYYVIPKGEGAGSYKMDLVNSAAKIRSSMKQPPQQLNIKYIQDDLFDLMPTDIVDIIFYCNPSNTDNAKKMRVYYSFQDGSKPKFYKPADLEDKEILSYLGKMDEWKHRTWNQL